jgi:RimJ/RimL family protein N-acetyltransferase
MSETASHEPLVLTSVDGTIELRTLMPDDAQTIYDLIEGDPSNITSYDSLADITYESPETIRDFIEYSQQYAPDLYRFGIWDVSQQDTTPTMVGVIELEQRDHQGATATWVGPAHRGSGYAARAAQPLIDFAFNDLSITQILRYIKEDNAPSVRTAEKLGFTRVLTDAKGMATFILNRSVEHD